MSEHTDVAAYSLGLLDPQDRLEFEAHLTDCRSCAAELADFAGLAELLAGVEPVVLSPVEPDEADEAAVVELISRRATALRQRARQRLVLVAVACLVVLAGGVAAGMATAPEQAPQLAQSAGQAHSATDKLTGASGTVHLVAMPYGTKITLDLSGVHGPLTCQLIAVSKTGQRAIAVGWRVPAAGYGVPGQPMHLVIAGGTAILPQDLSRVVVNVVGGGMLLSIPI
jgi:Flp pilus assembly protein CpaB